MTRAAGARAAAEGLRRLRGARGAADAGDRAWCTARRSARACEIAAACDFIVATPDAIFRTPEAHARHGRRDAAPAAHPRQAPGEGPDVHRPDALSAEEAQAGGLGCQSRRCGSRKRNAGNRRRPSSKRRRWRCGSPSAASTAASSSIRRARCEVEIAAIEEQLAAGTVDGQDVSWQPQTLGECSRASRQRRSAGDRLRAVYLSAAASKGERRCRGACRRSASASGDHVGILMGNDEKWLSLFYGAALIGAVTVPVNTRFKSRRDRLLPRSRPTARRCSTSSAS